MNGTENPDPAPTPGPGPEVDPPAPAPQAGTGTPRPRVRLVSLGLGLLALGVLSVLWLLFAPAGRREVRADLVIRPGMGLGRIARDLDSLGVSTHPGAFLLLARLMGVDRRIQPGVFPLEGRMSRRAILLQLGHYAVPGATVRIPEGLRLLETAGLVQRQSHLDSLRFLQVCRDTAFIAGLGLPGRPADLEGRLFPDTYELSTVDTEEVLVSRMARRMEQVIREVAGAAADSLDRHHLLTLASIVQGEYQIPGEADTIASVYLNRLRIGMRLQADPTVQYLLPVPRRLFYRDLFIDSPYNTYRNEGLPPGPINGPGRVAITAVLYPAQTRYLFFVADGRGGHIFGRTLAEHERNRIPLDLERRRLEALEDSLQAAAAAAAGITDTTAKP